MHLLRWLIPTLFFLPYSLLLAVAPPRIEQTYDELFKSMMDDPKGTNAWSKKLLEQGEGSLGEFNWSKALAIYASSCLEISCDNDEFATLENLNKALAIAEKSTDHPLFIRMHLIIDAFRSETGTEVLDHRAVLNKLKIIAEERGGGRLNADIYREFAAASESEGDLEQALTYARQALDLAEKHGFPGDILPILIKNDSSILAGRLGDFDQSITLYKQVIAYCKKENIRHMGAIALINLGRLYSKKDDEKSVRVGLAYFDQADAIIKELDEEDRLTMFSLLTRGEALLNLKDYAQAHIKIDAALHKIEKLNSTIWTADILHWKARIFAAEKRWSEALHNLDQSIALFPKHLVEDHEALARERAKALFHLGRSSEAYQAAENFIEQHEKHDQDERKDQVNRLQVQFGYKLQEQENQLLKKDNQLKEHQLREAALIKKVAIALGLLILMVLILLFFTFLQMKKVKQAKAKMHEILDNIEEGIITVGRDLRVESSLSPYLDHLIGHDAPESARQNVMLYLLEKSDLKADERRVIQEVIASCLEEAALVWELNAGHLPQELHLDHGQRILSLHWQPLYGKDQKIKRILIALRDSTLRRRLEQEIDEARVERTRLQHVLEEVSRLPPLRFQKFMEQAREKIQFIQQNDLQDASTHLLDLHSLKGEARTLGLKELATATHELEDYLDPRRGQPASEHEIRQNIHQWELVWNDYQNFALPITSQLSEERSTGLLQILADQWPAILLHCREKGIQLHRVCLDEEIFDWKKDVRLAIKDSLLHSLTNSIDHGFSRDGQQVDKPSFELRLTRNAQGMIEFSIRDNGKGLNWDRLDALIKERKFVPEQGQTLADVVFTEGLSTSEKITQTSGRGVGLSAIRQIVTRLQGEVHIKDREDQSGCELLLKLAE